MNSHICMKLSVYPRNEWMSSGPGNEKDKCSTLPPNFTAIIFCVSDGKKKRNNQDKIFLMSYFTHPETN